MAPIDDFNDVPVVSDALKDVDVIISALGGAASQLQIPIAEAAKSAGVRLFVPSEFGGDTDGAKEGYPAMKLALANKIAAIIPVTKFFNGTFADFIWSAPMTNLDVKSGSVIAGGDGNAKLSFTSRVDVARFVVYVLTTLAPEETVSKSFRIESQRLVRLTTVRYGRNILIIYCSRSTRFSRRTGRRVERSSKSSTRPSRSCRTTSRRTRATLQVTSISPGLRAMLWLEAQARSITRSIQDGTHRP